ncbi:YeeE/YedE family protein [Aquibacillus sp. 3ASR75-11]|uniref:YeeE/YedE family protein n=1 Tax=Terrihalobacillus insolitus TaxID=2950438 RepID=A0A9X3WVH0_9BACI|nr:YeeE/YedE family protein [Terrihalobacillus insolitus]MDC3414718.1 YeeE/YedE family protein [Terrihalobacillus insolitus]MDC3424169.1 YeeE/YedE family protein [Terrihalobacillus insolitus]
MGFTPEFFLYAAIFGLTYGILLQKADFCFVASVRDFISVKDSRVGKGVLILVATVLLGWGTVLTLGLASIEQVWTTPIGWSNLIGGILFGVGMTIAGSCASGTLYRSGMGYIHFWIVLASMIVGNLLFSFIYNPWAEDYYFKPLLVTDQGYSLFQLNLPYLFLPLLIVGLMIFIAIRQFGIKGFFQGFKESFADFKGNPFKKEHWDIRLVAALFGITATVQFVMMSSISLTGPETRIGGVALSLIFGDQFVYNNVYLNQMFAGFPVIGLGPEETLVIFIIVGAFLSAILSGQFRIRKPKAARMPYAIGGGLIMGVSSRMAPGCNIANIVGASGLSVSSIIVIIGMVIGVVIVTAFVFKMPLLLFQKMDMDMEFEMES